MISICYIEIFLFKSKSSLSHHRSDGANSLNSESHNLRIEFRPEQQKIAARFQVVFTALKLAVISLIIVTGLFHIFIRGRTENFREPFKGTNTDPGEMVLGLFASLFAYNGGADSYLKIRKQENQTNLIGPKSIGKRNSENVNRLLTVYDGREMVKKRKFRYLISPFNKHF